MRKVVIGIDVSKRTLDASMVFSTDANKNVHDSFLNKKLGFEQLLDWSLLQGNTEVFFCIENTGHYGRQLSEYLDTHGQQYALVNAAEIKLSMGIKREKSDKTDAYMIAQYGLKFPERMRENTLLASEILGLQLLLSQRKLLQEKELAFQRNLKLLKHCLSTDATAKLIIKDNTRHRAYLQKCRKKVEQKIEGYISGLPMLKTNYDLLQSIPGIGPIIASQTLVQTQNFTQIPTARKFSCYCGVAPFKHESGTSIRKGTRVSYFGHKLLKRILNFGAMTAVKSDPQLKEYYERKVAEGKSKMSVLNAVRNKLIHRMYATVKRGTPYVIQQTF
jgi:transposase